MSETPIYFSVQYLDHVDGVGNLHPGSAAPFAAHDVVEAAQVGQEARPGVEVYSVTRTWWDEDTVRRMNAARKPRKCVSPPRDSRGRVRLWRDNNGRITCLIHGGACLQAAVNANPRRHRHDTEIATFWVVPHTGDQHCEDCEVIEREHERFAATGSIK